VKIVLRHVWKFWNFFFCGAHSDSDDLPGNATVVYVIQLEDHEPNVVFQQDGALPHWARIIREFLDVHFPGRWVGRDRTTPWPPRSPDITPLDLFL
jgi:hypothetical protein